MGKRAPLRSAAKALLQMVVMAAVVTTLVFVPVALVFVLVLAASGASVAAWITLGAPIHPALALLLWWLVVFVGVCGYAAWLFPWGDRDFGWPGHR